ncbi:glycosyltransferase [Ornithinibacillus gellani]|uniref:glycosyltransferase n=1 Tax=Ornithinibacillus gellani TaxID=2293253 RepID=UPI000F49FB88|nr:glycosyltransferase [Ornithinibacillus gellani]TQS74120.1 glycosyltransferase [Ornithinibacillus gellani]
MNPHISIIVPVYNLKSLLPRCVESILAQTFTDFELILVNDGSTDGSGNLCERYAEQDKRIRVIHKENGGVASSRNIGLQAASGAYIGFVDNDDHIHPAMFETLYRQAKTDDADMVICDYIKLLEDEQSMETQVDPNAVVEHFDSTAALQQLYEPNAITYIVPWNKLYKKHLFNDITYEHGFICDDETVIHQLLYRCRKVSYIQKGLYYYVQRNDSQSQIVLKKEILQGVYAYKNREVFFRKLKEKNLHQLALLAFEERFFRFYIFAKSTLPDAQSELKKMKRTFNRSLFFLWLHREMGWRKKIMCTLFFIHPSLYEMLRTYRERRNASRA